MSEDGLRERKKAERRRRIEAAALDLIEAKGFEGATVQEISARAGISTRTFFYYFDTKEDVVLADYAARLARITEELGRRPPSEAPWDALRSSFVVVASDYAEQRGELVRRFRIMAMSPSVAARSLQLQAGWEDALADRVAARSGSGADDIESRLLASAALACIRSALRHWLATGQGAALPELVEGCFARMATGLSELRPAASGGP